MVSRGIGSLLSLGGSQDLLLTVTGLFAYWKADNVTVSGGVIVTMPDQSGNRQTARDLTVPTTGPTYNAVDTNFNSKPSVSGTTGQARRVEATLDTSLVQAYTTYTVMRVETNANYMYWRSNAGNFTDSAGFYVQPTLTATLQVNDVGSAVTSATSLTAGTSYVNCCIYNTGTSAIYFNDSQTAFASAPGDGTIDANNCAVVSVGTFTAEECDYSWTTMALYSGAHDAATRSKIMKSLGSKYGITVT